MICLESLLRRPPALHHSQAYSFYTWYACITYFVAHPIIMLLCSLLISARLIAAQRSRTALAASGSTEQRRSPKELQASLTVVTLALLQCAVYVPCAVGCMPYCFVNTNTSLEVSKLLLYTLNYNKYRNALL